MAAPEELAELKTGPNRTVRVESAGEADGPGARRLVKRFHGRGPAARWGDARRARREARAHEALRRAGLPVPAVLELRPTGDGRELVLEWIPGAVSLRELYLGRAPWPVARARLAAELGRLLARAQAAGLVHGDPHAGNVLVDGAGRPWVVDLARARLRARPPARALERELIALAADAREHVPFGFRARALVAWGAARGLRERAAFGARIEELARARRRQVVRKSRARWRRESGVCRAERTAGGTLYARRELDAGERARLSELLAERAEHPRPERRERGAAPDGADVLLLAWPRAADALRAWCEAGRFDDHGLPCARPLALLAGAATSVAAFRLPFDVRRPDAELPAIGAGRLAGALCDRGLELRSGGLWMGSARELVLDPRAHVVSAPGTICDLGERVAADERPRYVEAFLAELRGGPAERRRVRAELERA